jgi:hypothetical protein
MLLLMVAKKGRYTSAIGVHEVFTERNFSYFTLNRRSFEKFKNRKSLRPEKIRQNGKSLRPEKIRQIEKSLRPEKIRRIEKSLRALKSPSSAKY